MTTPKKDSNIPVISSSRNKREPKKIIIRGRNTGKCWECHRHGATERVFERVVGPDDINPRTGQPYTGNEAYEEQEAAARAWVDLPFYHHHCAMDALHRRILAEWDAKQASVTELKAADG